LYGEGKTAVDGKCADSARADALRGLNMKKTVKATLYMESKLKFAKRKIEVFRDTDGYLFSGGVYPTKILPKDLPEWYIYGYIYKQHGYMSAKGVKHLLYVPNYHIENHLHKYDNLFISYNEPIEPIEQEKGFQWYKGFDHVIDGGLIVKFVDATEKYSSYDVSEIQREIARKTEFYYEKNPK
jgi:hypothetical protein